MLESDIQKQIVDYMRARNIFFFSVPNERKDMRMLNKLRAMGYLPGAADLVILHDGRFYAMEVKAKTGRLSENQKIFRQRVFDNGGEWALVRSIDQAVEALTVWGII